MASSISKASAAALLVAAFSCGGCYHFAFEQRPARTTTTAADGQIVPLRTVTYEEEVPTFINGFVETGTIDTSHYCDAPLRTELRVTLRDVLISMVTLLVYTPHTLSVTCEVAAR